MGGAGTLGGGVEGAAGWRRAAAAAAEAPPCGEGVLQLLGRDQADLVPLLGRSTGWDTDKRGGCAALGYEWATVAGRWV